MDPLVVLGDQLEGAATRAERVVRPRGHLRWPLSRPVALVAVGVLLAAGAASAAVILSVKPSAPLSGTTLGGRQYDIGISPYLRAGEVGWCVSVSYTANGRLAGWGEQCGGEQWSQIVADSASWPRSTAPTLNWAITAPSVAAVRFGHRVVRTRTDPRLPYGFRAAVELLPPGRAARRAPSRHRLLFPEPLMPVEALDAQGRVIQSSTVSRVTSAVAKANPRLSHSVPGHRDSGRMRAMASTTVYWMPPSIPPSIPCSIHSTPISGLRPQWGNVATYIVPVVKVQGRAFLPCADTEFSWSKWPLQAAVLLDAAHPGSQPAMLPQMQPVPGHLGTFDAPGSIQGHLTARRVGNAWLVVQGGDGLQQRLAVLNDLRIVPPSMARG